MFDAKRAVPIAPLYRDVFEHDNCGIGACVDIKGKKSHGCRGGNRRWGGYPDPGTP